MIETALLVVLLCGVCAAFMAFWWKSGDLTSYDSEAPEALHIAIGAFTNFFDTFGVSAAGVTIALFRINRRMTDRVIPGTQMVGHTIPTVIQTLIFIKLLQVDIVTLLPMILAAVTGVWLGSAVIGRMPLRAIQAAMGLGLLAGGLFLAAAQLDVYPLGGAAVGLRGSSWLVGIVGNLVLGALVPVGIGFYSPGIVLCSLLGMNPLVAFPMVRLACAFVMPAGGIAFVRNQHYNYRAALGLTLGGVPAVLLAAYVVRQLPLDAFRWMVVVLVGMSAIGLLITALHGRPEKLRRKMIQ